MTSVLENGNRRREANPAKRSFRRSFRTVSTLAALVAAVVVSSPAQAFENLTPAEREALTVRLLQSDMMVVALSCQMRDEYNAMVTRFQRELVRHGTNLRALLERTYGSGAEGNFGQGFQDRDKTWQIWTNVVPSS